MSSDRLFRRTKKDGTQSRIWYAWVYVDGKRDQRSTRCTDKRAAEAVRARWEREATDPHYAATNQATVRAALDLVIDRAESLARTGRRSADTVSFYRAKVGHLSRLLDGEHARKLSTLDAAAVDAYVRTRQEEGAGDSTIAKELGALRLALKLARRVGIFDRDPSQVLPVLHGTGYTPRTRWLTEEEATLLIAQLVPDRAARVAWIIATGGRLGESDRARRDDITRTMVALRGTKTKLSLRSVPLVLQVQQVLIDYALTYAEGRAQMFEPWGNVRRDIAAACSRAGIAKCTPNDLRRTLAHWLRQAGAGADLVAPVLGHADSRMVERVYGRLQGAELAAALLRACSAGAAEPAERLDPSESAEQFARSIATNFVPRDGIEPSTRGFSVRGSGVVRLLPNPRKDKRSTAARKAGAAPVQQRLRRVK